MNVARIVCAGLLAAVAAPALGSAAAPLAEVAPASMRMIARGDHNIAFYVIPGSRGTIVLDAGSGQDASH